MNVCTRSNQPQPISDKGDGQETVPQKGLSPLPFIGKKEEGRNAKMCQMESLVKSLILMPACCWYIVAAVVLVGINGVKLSFIKTSKARRRWLQFCKALMDVCILCCLVSASRTISTTPVPEGLTLETRTVLLGVYWVAIAVIVFFFQSLLMKWYEVKTEEQSGNQKVLNSRHEAVLLYVVWVGFCLSIFAPALMIYGTTTEALWFAILAELVLVWFLAVLAVPFLSVDNKTTNTQESTQ